MPRTNINMPRTAASRRRQIQNFPYSLYFPGTSGNDMTVGTDVYQYERTQPFSLAFWIYIVSYPTTNGHIFAEIQSASPFRGRLSRLQVSGGITYLNFYLINTFGSNQMVAFYLPPAIGKWVRVVETYSGNSNTSGVKVYYDNVLQTQASTVNSLTATIVASGVTTKWGGFAGAGQNANMYLAAPTVLDYEMTAQQVDDDWYKPNSGNAPIDTYPFTEGSGTSVASTGTGAHNGTLGAGVTWSSTVVPMKARTVINQARLAVS